jgi:hypothetical protein
MGIFSKDQPAAPVPAFTKLKLDLDIAVANARQAGLSAVVIADELELRTDLERQRHATSAPSSYAPSSPATPYVYKEPAVKKLAALIAGRK